MSAELKPEQVAELLTVGIVIESGRRMLLAGKEMPLSLGELTDFANLVLERERATLAQQAAPSDDLQSDFMDWAKRHYEPTLGDNWGCVTFASNGGMVALAAYKAGRMESFAATSSQAAPSVDVVIDGYTYDGQTIRAILQDWIDYGAEAHDARKRGAAQSQAAPSASIDTASDLPKRLRAYARKHVRGEKCTLLLDAAFEIERLAAPTQAAPSASIDTPEFRALVRAHRDAFNAHAAFMGSPEVRESWAALVAHVDARPAATEPAPDAASEGGQSAIETFYSYRTRPLDSIGRVDGEWTDRMPCTAEQYRAGGNLVGLEREFYSTTRSAATTGEPGQSRDGGQAPGDVVDQFVHGALAALAVVKSHQGNGSVLAEEIIAAIGEENIYRVADDEDYELAGLDPSKKPGAAITSAAAPTGAAK